MWNRLFKKVYRAYRGTPNSRLQTLLDANGDACYKIALNYLNMTSCAIQKRLYQINHDYYETALACNNCPLEREYEGHKLNILVKELEPIK